MKEHESDMGFNPLLCNNRKKTIFANVDELSGSPLLAQCELQLAQSCASRQ
jgi:hypothetical protein